MSIGTDKKEYEKGCWYDVNTFRFFTDYFPTAFKVMILSGKTIIQRNLGEEMA